MMQGIHQQPSSWKQDRSGVKTSADWLEKYAPDLRSILFNEAVTLVGAHVNALQQLLLPTDRWEDLSYVMDMVRLCAMEYTWLYGDLDRGGKHYTEELGVQLAVWAHLGRRRDPFPVKSGGTRDRTMTDRTTGTRAW